MFLMLFSSPGLRKNLKKKIYSGLGWFHLTAQAVTKNVSVNREKNKYKLTDNSVVLLGPFAICLLGNSTVELVTFCRSSWINDFSECPRVEQDLVDRQS